MKRNGGPFAFATGFQSVCRIMGVCVCRKAPQILRAVPRETRVIFTPSPLSRSSSTNSDVVTMSDLEDSRQSLHVIRRICLGSAAYEIRFRGCCVGVEGWFEDIVHGP